MIVFKLFKCTFFKSANFNVVAYMKLKNIYLSNVFTLSLLLPQEIMTLKKQNRKEIFL